MDVNACQGLVFFKCKIFIGQKACFSNLKL
jgi:hypothetical protein